MTRTHNWYVMPKLNETKKEERLQIRTDPYTKSKLQRAADYSHKSISDFVLSNSVVAADRIISEKEVKALSQLDWEAFYGALLNPPEPNKKLHAAFKRYLKTRK